MSDVNGNLRKGIWRFSLSRPLSVSLTLMSSKAAELNEHRLWSLWSLGGNSWFTVLDQGKAYHHIYDGIYFTKKPTILCFYFSLGSV